MGFISDINFQEKLPKPYLQTFCLGPGLQKLHPPSEKKCTCTDKKLRLSKAQFLNFLARVSELKVLLPDKADGI